MMKSYIITLILLLFVSNSFAQNHRHTLDSAKKSSEIKKSDKPARKEMHKPSENHVQPVDTSHKHHQHMEHTEMPVMSHAFSLNLPMNRNGSGTGWLPDASPMYGYMLHANKWMFMFHGNLFLRYNNQDVAGVGSRGDEQFDAPNWLMAMGQRKVGSRGLFRFSSMFSLDPLTVGGSGYPLLFQSGETFEGKPLVDRQHPHDFISELSVAYTHMLSKKADLTAYLGYPGEPALGPVAFMHRVSALDNPNSPLGHHWQDASHITFGVATLGLRVGKFKLEGSSFTGREPDENRFDFDEPRFDSYSYRLSFNPSEHWALQASHGFLHSPEALKADEDVERITASAIYQRPLHDKNYFTMTGVWGYNNAGHGHEEHSILLEPLVRFSNTSLYGRYEWVEKSADELDLHTFEHDAVFDVHSLTIGVNQVLLQEFKTSLAVGAQGSVYSADPRLDPIYGKNPISVEIYVRIYPYLMK